jgi:hypothetical protein
MLAFLARLHVFCSCKYASVKRGLLRSKRDLLRSKGDLLHRIPAGRPRFGSNCWKIAGSSNKKSPFSWSSSLCVEFVGAEDRAEDGVEDCKDLSAEAFRFRLRMHLFFLAVRLEFFQLRTPRFVLFFPPQNTVSYTCI